MLNATVGPKVGVMGHPARLALKILALIVPGATYAREGKAIAVDRADQIQVMKDVGKVETVRLYGIHTPVSLNRLGRRRGNLCAKGSWERSSEWTN